MYLFRLTLIWEDGIRIVSSYIQYVVACNLISMLLLTACTCVGDFLFIHDYSKVRISE